MNRLARTAPVQSVTTARESPSGDVEQRQRRYLMMMGIRLACLPLAVIVDGWARWVFIAGAVVLPYIAVVIANAVSRPTDGSLTPVEPDKLRALSNGSIEDRDSVT
jgi:hypothetical protein